MWGAFDARKKASQGHDHCQFRANDRAYNGVLGNGLCRYHLGGIPALEAKGAEVQTARRLIFEARCKRKTGPSLRSVDNKTHSAMLAKFTPKKGHM
jgi:hypothetical protein